MHNGGQIDRYSTGRPKIKWACAKRLQEEALHTAKGQEPKNRHRVTEAKQDEHSTGHPKIKWTCTKRSSKKKPSIQQGQELEDPSNGTKIKIGSKLTKEDLLARIKGEQERRANEPSLLNIGAKRFTP